MQTGASKAFSDEKQAAAWSMLLVLCGTFALSQAYRTLAGILASPLQAELHLSAQQLGVFAAAYHFAFGAMQLFMGVGIDVYGVRRTLLVVFPCAFAGAVLSAMTTDYGLLVLGQVLIGAGCAPAFLVCTVFIARCFPADRFAAVSGAVLGIGGLGMIFTGTPVAWIIEQTHWRNGFVVLAVLSVVAWGAVLWRLQEPEAPEEEAAVSPWAALCGFMGLFRMPHTLAIVILGGLTYAAVMALRGLWLGPLLIEEYGYSLVQSGHVALVMSVVMLFGGPLFGRLDPGNTRRRWIVVCTLIMAALFIIMAWVPRELVAVVASLVIGLLSGYIVLQYADVRVAYPAHLTGRAMGVFTMAMFLGIAVVQWLTGVVATQAALAGWPPFAAVFGLIAALLVAGTAAFVLLPRPADGDQA